jgi:hypothetical protein
MQDKWMILVVGLVTVFVALIAIIAMLEIFHRIFGKRPEKKRQGLAPLPEINTLTPKAETREPVDPRIVGNEIIAVISAAVAAASGQSPSSFRLTSVQPSGGERESFNTPIWGRIERFSQK